MTAEEQAAQHAQTVRDEHGLGVLPVPDLVEFVSDHADCDVVVMAMDDGVDGVIARDPQTGRVYIAVKACDQWARQRLTLAHELGQLLTDGLDRDLPADCRSDDAAESAASNFGRHLLAPDAGVNALLRAEQAERGQIDTSHLSLVVHHFGVSPQVASIQMRRTGWISADQDAHWRADPRVTTRWLATRYGWRAEHDRWAADATVSRPPVRLLRRVTDAYVAGQASVAAVAAVAGITEQQARDWLDAEDIHPQPKRVQVKWFDFGDDTA